jgi:WD40 repeat protein
VFRSWTIAEPEHEPRVWNLEQGNYVMHDSPALGRSIATWNGKKFRILDPWTGKLKVVVDGPGMTGGESLNHFAFSDDARVLAAHTSLNRVFWWDAGSGRAIASLPSSGAVRMQISPRGTYLAVVDDRARVTVFNLSRREKTTLDRGSEHHGIRGCSLSFSSDETLLALVIDPIPGGIQPAEVWDLLSMRRSSIFPGRRDIDSVPFIPRSRSLVVSGGTKPRIWRLDPPSSPDALRGHTDEAWSAAFSPDGKLLATGSDDTDERQTIKLWDPASGRLLAGWNAHTATVVSLAFSPDGRFLASSSLDSGKPGDANVLIWDVASRSQVASFQGHVGPVRSLEFSPDGKLLATAGDDGSVRLWNAADRSSRALLEGHVTKVNSLAFSPDSARLASGSCDATVKIWNVSTGELQSSLQHGANVNAVAFAPGRSLLAAAGDDGQIKLWNPETGDSILNIYSAADQLRCLAFTRDGRYITASGRDKVIRLWDITTGQEVLSLTGHEAQVNALAFSPDGLILASCSHDGAVKLWRAEPIEVVTGR